MRSFELDLLEDINKHTDGPLIKKNVLFHGRF